MQVETHLPEGFRFFDVGILKTTNGKSFKKAAPVIIVSFQLTGDESGTCLICFDRAPHDPSMAVEIANILVSKFVSNINDGENSFVELSPPLYMETGEKSHLLHSAYSAAESNYAEGVRRNYTFHGAERFHLKLIYIPSQKGTA